jgi:hypothetical protein
LQALLQLVKRDGPASPIFVLTLIVRSEEMWRRLRGQCGDVAGKVGRLAVVNQSNNPTRVSSSTYHCLAYTFYPPPPHTHTLTHTRPL